MFEVIMKEDFIAAKQQLPGICRIASDFYAQPKKKGSVFFVKSPATNDKTASLALYPTCNRFCDFANGNQSGDSISFVAYVRGCSNWQALKELQAFYGLTNAKGQDKQEARQRIELQRQEKRKKAERKQAFYAALLGEIDHLKRWAAIYSIAIEKVVYEPFTDEWCYCMNELQKTDYKLDILCAADCKAYSRLKAFHENLPSDRYQWLLDCLPILQESGAFKAEKDETEEITAQRDYELIRQPGGAARRCKVEW